MTVWCVGSVQSFDKGGASPVLRSLLSSGAVDVSGKRAIVPGCGRGYDVFVLARAGAAQAVGLELSRTAVEQARAFQEAQGWGDLGSKVDFQVGDFFDSNREEGAYDVGYDYTFFCALHPTMRKDWANAWRRALKPGGVLVTLVYPVDSTADPSTGPPWPVTPALYEEFLKDGAGAPGSQGFGGNVLLYRNIARTATYHLRRRYWLSCDTLSRHRSHQY